MAGRSISSGHTYSLSDAERCYRVFDHESAFIECNLPIAFPLAQTFPLDNAMDCIIAKHSNSTLSLARSHLRGFFDQVKDETVEQPYNSAINKLRRRQPDPKPKDPLPCTSESIVTGTSLVGDENAHQNALDKQLSEPVTCAQDAGCSASEQQSVSYAVGFSASATIVH